jgi:hypothetical protein
VCWKPCSSCWSFHLLREEFLSAPIHSPLSGSPYRSFSNCRIDRHFPLTKASDRPMVSTLRPSNHPVLLSLLLLLRNSSNSTRKWTVGSSDGVNFISASAQCTKCSDACTDGTVCSSDGVFFLPFLRVFNLDLCFNLKSLTYLTCHYL